MQWNLNQDKKTFLLDKLHLKSRLQSGGNFSFCVHALKIDYWFWLPVWLRLKGTSIIT